MVPSATVQTRSYETPILAMGQTLVATVHMSSGTTGLLWCSVQDIFLNWFSGIVPKCFEIDGVSAMPCGDPLIGVVSNTAGGYPWP